MGVLVATAVARRWAEPATLLYLGLLFPLLQQAEGAQIRRDRVIFSADPAASCFTQIEDKLVRVLREGVLEGLAEE
jgi:hypothetical protein